MKGFVHELASLAAIVLGIILAYSFSDEVALYLSNQFDEEGAWIKILSYVLIFFSVGLSLHFIASALTRMLKMMSLGLVNRILGAVFGLIKMLLILLILVFLLDPYVSDLRKSSPSWQQSEVYDQLKAYSYLPGEILTNFSDTSAIPEEY